MSYRVEYQPVKQRKKGGSRLIALTALCLLLFLLLVNGFWPRGTQVLREWVLPGDAAVTAAALEELAVELKSGEPISGALESFCRRIMAEAEFDPR